MIRTLSSFEQLSVAQLFDALKLRSEVFVLEQNCLYLDPDAKDKSAYHLLYQTDSTRESELVAYARLLPSGISYPDVSFGRVVVANSFRGKGIGKEIVKDAINSCKTLWPDKNITIGAQSYLFDFYNQLGFEAISEEYLEDGILHLDMQLQVSK